MSERIFCCLCFRFPHTICKIQYTGIDRLAEPGANDDVRFPWHESQTIGSAALGRRDRDPDLLEARLGALAVAGVVVQRRLDKTVVARVVEEKHYVVPLGKIPVPLDEVRVPVALVGRGARVHQEVALGNRPDLSDDHGGQEEGGVDVAIDDEPDGLAPVAVIVRAVRVVLVRVVEEHTLLHGEGLEPLHFPFAELGVVDAGDGEEREDEGGGDRDARHG